MQLTETNASNFDFTITQEELRAFLIGKIAEVNPDIDPATINITRLDAVLSTSKSSDRLMTITGEAVAPESVTSVEITL